MKGKIEKNIRKYKDHAEKSGFKLNPDKKIVENLVKILITNEEKEGEKYCPCSAIHEKSLICPCEKHKKEIKEKGHCHCFLFVSKDF